MFLQQTSDLALEDGNYSSTIDIWTILWYFQEWNLRND